MLHIAMAPTVSDPPSQTIAQHDASSTVLPASAVLRSLRPVVAETIGPPALLVYPPRLRLRSSLGLTRRYAGRKNAALREFGLESIDRCENARFDHAAPVERPAAEH